MLKLNAKDVEKFLYNNELKTVETALNANYKDLLYHGVLLRTILEDEKKYLRQGVLLSVLGTGLAVFSTPIFPIALGAMGASVGVINMFNSAKGMKKCKDVLYTLSLTMEIFNKATSEECQQFLENVTPEEFNDFLDRTYFCE